MIDLSLCMITKNEETNIERCLKSVAGLVNEIIIVDTGSTDRTVEIARSLGANVYKHIIEPFDFSRARNIALNYSMGKWILHLDADEALDSKAFPKIEKIIQTEDKKAYICSIVNFISESSKNLVEKRFPNIRLFKYSSGVRYKRACHEEIYFSLYDHGYEIIKNNINIFHYGYQASTEILKQKANRNLEILLRMFENSNHFLTAFQIAQSYIVIEDYESSKQYFQLALKDSRCTNDYKKYIESNLRQIKKRVFDKTVNLEG